MTQVRRLLSQTCCIGWLSLSAIAFAGAPKTHEPARLMPDVITRYSADERSLEETYTLRVSPERFARFDKFYSDELTALTSIPFAELSHEDQVDYVVLKTHIRDQQHELTRRKKEIGDMASLLPFLPAIDKLVDEKRQMKPPNSEAAAAALNAMTESIVAFEKTRKDAGPNAPKVDKALANQTVQVVGQLQRSLKNWFTMYDGYDPMFTWWVALPYQKTDEALKNYREYLQKELVGIAPDDKLTIIGDPVGRDALLADLQDDMIPYTPEELIAIAQTEYDWCMKEMLKASHEMGYGDDWHAAVEKIKQMHVPPGEQPELIRGYMSEADDYVQQHNLVTVPPLATETLRMIMMTPERQLVNPFFTGGDEISVSYPTDTMTYAQRMMSMRGNSGPLSHATVFHEMIPGHFLQFYMSARYNPYREEFETPFWHEGNSLWWEMLLYEMGFQKTPAERVGALVWRMHRSARVIFTMNFHLGRWTPQQCVQFLIDNVGFEPDNATAEVRRSFDGSVGPLYQSAYLMGGLQFRAMHHELVDSGKMTNQQFHDAILHENSMPIELLRADLENLPLTPDYTSSWK